MNPIIEHISHLSIDDFLKLYNQIKSIEKETIFKLKVVEGNIVKVIVEKIGDENEKNN